MKRSLTAAALAVALLIPAAPVSAAAVAGPSPCQIAKVGYASARRAEGQAAGALAVAREHHRRMSNLTNRLVNKAAGAQVALTKASAALATTNGYAAAALAKRDAAQAAHDAALAGPAAPGVITRTRLNLRSATNNYAFWQSQVAGRQTTEATMTSRLAAAEAELDAQELLRDAALAGANSAQAAHAAAVIATADARTAQISAC
jgi:hypothetical protein